MFVLAHLSDPHLAPIPTPRVRELASKRGLGFINWYRGRHAIHRPEVLALVERDLAARTVDHIAVTGDLVNLALAAEFAAAHQWLARLGPPERVTVVPGNHDAYVRAAAAHPLRYWGDYMRGDAAGPITAPGAPAHFPFVRRRGPAALVGLSTAVPTGPLMATGRLGADQLMRLDDALDALGREGLFRIVLIHHPPVSRLAQHFKRLVDAAPLRRVIARHGAELVLHGHAHVHLLTWLDGPRGRVPAVGVPSASAAADPHGDAAAYNLYAIERDADGWRCEAVTRGVGDGALTETGRRMLSL
ncbi:MAG TPA: metallophosphoesterase [Xanthobacteraceae bacterium]|nr:metallophosphoesterase [Xanthobacteraceae bacterium]